MKVWALRLMGWTALLLALALASFSCGGPGGGTPPVEKASGTGYIFMGDTPPPGASVLKFAITLSNATLCQTVGSAGECQGTSQVSLLDSPVDIELNQLQLRSAFLSLKTVQAGTYAGVKLTFSNPALKLLLADGSVQELQGLTLPLSPASVTLTFSNGLTVSGNSTFSFQLDFEARASIQSTGTSVTSISPTVSLVQLPVAAQQLVEELPDTLGTVANLSKVCPTGNFTLVDSLTGLSLANIEFDGSTAFGDGLTCETLGNEQAVEADVELRAQSLQSVQFFATGIEFVNAPLEHSLEGVIFQVNNASEFVLLLNGGENVSIFPDGAFVTVDFDPTNVLFSLDAGDLAVDPLAFASGADLLAGQAIEVGVLSGSLVPGTNNCAAIGDNCAAGAAKLRLKKGTLSGRVAGTSTPTFTLDTLPSIFGSPILPVTFRPLAWDCQNCVIQSVQVATSDKTVFEGGLLGFSSLQVGNVVSARGLLVKGGFSGPGPMGTGSPQLVAAKVRLRSI